MAFLPLLRFGAKRSSLSLQWVADEVSGEETENVGPSELSCDEVSNSKSIAVPPNTTVTRVKRLSSPQAPNALTRPADTSQKR